jgi:hypothetical protein
MKAGMSIGILRALLILAIFTAVSYANPNENIGATGENSALIESGYFPLSVGNVYKYHYGSSSGFNYDYKVRIISEVYIDSVKYYVADQLFPAGTGTILRNDSITGNLYRRANSGYCSYSPFEILVDSLLAGIGDTALVCTEFQRLFSGDTGRVTRFGIQIKTKSFGRKAYGYSVGLTYGKNFGIIFATYSDQWGAASESLTGCCINGILYGDTILTGVDIVSSETPGNFTLHQNYPNPFNASTTIRFDVRMTGFVSLKVFDALGKEVASLSDEHLRAGSYSVNFRSDGLSSGVYFYALRASGYSKTLRLIVLK